MKRPDQLIYNGRGIPIDSVTSRSQHFTSRYIIRTLAEHMPLKAYWINCTSLTLKNSLEHLNKAFYKYYSSKKIQVQH